MRLVVVYDGRLVLFLLTGTHSQKTVLSYTNAMLLPNEAADCSVQSNTCVPSEILGTVYPIPGG